MLYIKESVLNEEDTHNDYPAAAKKNAQMAIDWKEEHGRDEVEAGTPVGWARAHQLAKGENLSTDTVKRMSAFNRHRKNSSIKPELKETPWKDRGYVAWLIWGGDEGVDWAIEKSKEIDAMKESNQLRYIKPINEAENYITDKFKVGDKINTEFGEWEVIETDYAPKKRFTSPFIFKGDDMKRLDLNAPPTNKQAVGYKVTDGDKYPIIGFLYQYKDITKLATIGVDESVTEKLTRGLKPLLTIGSTITKNAGEDALLDLSDKFDRIDDEYAGTIASWLDMAIELMQDRYAGAATKKLKQFNKACKDVLNGKEIGSAFESVTEAKKYKFKDINKAWSHVYGEDMEDEYQGFYQEVTGKYKDKVTKADIAKIWSSVYGEDITDEYDGFYNDLQENLKQVAKLERLDNLNEQNADGTISDDEDDRLDDLLGDVEMQIDELIQHAQTQAYEIGGSFRGPGMTAKTKKIMLDKLKRMKN